MRKFYQLVITAVLGVCFNTCLAQYPGNARYVDPFIGTAVQGHTYPGATSPFGLVQVSPETGNVGWNYCSGYHYEDKKIMGFSHTHLSGTGWMDLGDILFMPFTGPVEKNIKAAFRTIESRPSHRGNEINDYNTIVNFLIKYDGKNNLVIEACLILTLTMLYLVTGLARKIRFYYNIMIRRPNHWFN
jgi:putative alpha-1,2-mannosidase